MAHNQAAYLTSKHGPIEVKEAPLHTPKAHEVLIKNAAIAINPVDWKIQEYEIFPQKYPVILGEDVAGEVEAVGEGVEGLKKGDRVLGYAALALGGASEYSGFQKYTVVQDFLVTKIPDSVKFQDASVIPLGIATAAHGLFGSSHLKLERPTGQRNEALKNKSLLVWGGASSVGASAIQLAANAGYTVIATASPANHELVLSLGAHKVFDYNDKDIIEKLKAAVHGEWVGAYDAISENGTVEKSAAVIGKGFVATTLPAPKDLPSGITAQGVYAAVLGKGEKELGEFIFSKYLPVAIKEGKIKFSPPPHVVGHGLEKIQEALKAQKTARGVKVVVTL